VFTQQWLAYLETPFRLIKIHLFLIFLNNSSTHLRGSPMWKPSFITVDHIPKGGLKKLPTKLLPFIWFFIKQVKWPLLLFLFIEAIAVACFNLTPFFIREFTDILTEIEKSGDLQPTQLLQDALPILFWFVGIVYIARNIAKYLNFYLMNASFMSYFREMTRCQLALYLRGQSLDYFANDFAGRLTAKVAEVARAINMLVAQLIRGGWNLAVALITAALLLASAHWIFVAIFGGWFVLYATCLIYFIPRISPLSQKVANANSKTSGRLVDSISNILLVKLFSQQKYENDYQLEAGKDAADKAYARDCFQLWLWISMSVLATALAASTGYIAFKGVSEGWITPGDALLAFTVVPGILSTTWWVSDVLASIFDQFGIIQDGMDTLAKPYTITDKDNAFDLKVHQGKVQFKNVHFKYNKDTDIFTGLDLTVKPGEKVGIVGRSGAGKSTLANLLLRFYDVDKGTVLIDNQNIANCTQDSLRQHIAMVTQDTSLLHRSIADNIRYAKPDATMHEIIRATKKAHADNFIPNLTDQDGRTGYDALVGERGVKLSGGQRQRIAIARVILEDAPILVLDEATSALDSEVEDAIQENLSVLMEDKTVIAIAHRLSTLSIMDRIVVMKNGCIAEDGTHDELIAKGGIYANLWQRQSGGFLPSDE
jgi:ATP-binding cassette subfamily B multidrug efflux pump